MTDLTNYYTAPAQHIFEEIKEKSISIWKTYDDKYGYATEKINRIKDVQNIKDNAWYIVAMFDWQNQQKLLNSLSAESRKKLSEILEEAYTDDR